MSPAPPTRRVSYVIPPLSTAPQALQLPRLGVERHGISTPLLIPVAGPSATTSAFHSNTTAQHPKHRLGISAFALDTVTRLSGRVNPEGILYSGGRDGMIIAHELGIPLKLRSHPYLHASGNQQASGKRWETITGWADIDDEDAEDDELNGPPFERRWVFDTENIDMEMNTSFRQSVQIHSDWVNDIVLCNYNRTLISCSSDGTVKSWNPHDPQASMDPEVIGRHSDYVRCLAQPRNKNWVASGAFDRTIKIWEINSKRKEPVVTLTQEASNSKTSIYALATDPNGTLLASGSPERVVRLWDPRSGKRTGKLVGHTDNIRSILISDDGRYMLTGSADASIKLWSLATHRCLHTFAHHTDSIWSMTSSHPSLSIFYSGDRSGNVCRVDVEGCSDMSEGECILLCKETPTGMQGSEGINGLISLDDRLVWTATSSSSINCWRTPACRLERLAEVGDIESPVRNPSPFGMSMDTNPLLARHRDSFGADKDGWIRSDSPVSFTESSLRKPEPTRNLRRTGQLQQPSAPSNQPSMSSLNTALAGQTTSPTATTSQLGLPFQSLIKLASPPDSFTSPFQYRGREADASTLYSAASIRSIPMPVRPLNNNVRTQTEPARYPMPQPSLHRSVTSIDAINSIQPTMSSGHLSSKFVAEPEDSARLAYESREVAADALPLQVNPAAIVEGTEGIVRSIILNDRWHALTVDTLGHVCVWDVIRGICCGAFDKTDVEQASREHSSGPDWKWSPREALEAVRERVEGEAVIQAWCTVDSSIGNLMVHINGDRAFEAEIYADEAGFGQDVKFEEDHRLNLGKWILGNLFAPFVAHEQMIQAPPPQSSHSGAPGSPAGRSSISRQGGPSHINLEARRVRSIAEISAVQRTPGLAASMATAPVTPAVLPDLPPDALQKVASANASTGDIGSKSRESGLHTIPQSPASTVGSTPKMPARSQTLDTVTGSNDYFSLKRKASLGPDDGTESAADSKEGLLTAAGGSSASLTVPATTPITPASPGSSAAQLPGATSLKFIGKLKVFGKQKKTGAESAETPATPAPATGTAEGEKAHPPKPPTPTLLQRILAKPLTPPPFTDMPTIPIHPMTGIFLSEASSDTASGWSFVYRGLLSTQTDEEDLEVLERELPPWLLEFLLTNKVGGAVGGGGPGNGPKFSFMVVPWKGADPNEYLPELLTNQSKLTAGRFLRVKKILVYVKEKVDSLEKADKKETLLENEQEENQPPRPPSARSIRTTRSSYDGHHTASHKPSSKAGVPGSPPTTLSPIPAVAGNGPSSSTQRTRPPSSSSSKSGMSGHTMQQHHYGHHTGSLSSRHKRTSRVTAEEALSATRKPEDLYELLCNDVLLSNQMTLAAVKQYVWKGSAELVMEYRRKRISSAS